MNAPAESPLREIADLPRPPGLPLFGNALQIQQDRLHQTLEAWHRQYGDYYRFALGKRKFLVIGDAEAIAQSLRNRPEGFQRTERLNKAAHDMGFGGVFSANGEQWKRQRPMVMAGFDPAHIKKYFPMLLKVTERFLKRWQRAAARDASHPTSIDLTADLMRYTVDVVGGLAFGADINTIESDEEVIQKHLDKVLPALAKGLLSPFAAFVRKLPLPANRRLDGHLDALRVAVEGFIAGARRRVDANPKLREEPDNLIEAMVVARDREGSGLTDTDVAGNVLTMLLAGEDTTANTLAWMIYLLARHPAALARARDEVRAKLGAAALPTREQLEELPFIEACMNETMRVKPVAPMIIQQAVRDTSLAGIRVPKGYLVVLLMRAPTMQNKHFASAATFDPARWLDAAVTPASAKRVAMPFGAGPRLCPGRYLAMLEMKMVMAMLLRNFDIQSVSTPDGKEAQESLNLTMAPVGLRLTLMRNA
jgi:cytochrome P450